MTLARLILAANGENEEVTGYSTGELVGSHFHALLVGAEQAGLVARQFERKRHDRTLVTSYEVEILRSDETRR